MNYLKEVIWQKIVPQFTKVGASAIAAWLAKPEVHSAVQNTLASINHILPQSHQLPSDVSAATAVAIAVPLVTTGLEWAWHHVGPWWKSRAV